MSSDNITVQNRFKDVLQKADNEAVEEVRERIRGADDEAEALAVVVRAIEAEDISFEEGIELLEQVRSDSGSGDSDAGDDQPTSTGSQTASPEEEKDDPAELKSVGGPTQKGSAKTLADVLQKDRSSDEDIDSLAGAIRKGGF